MTPSPPAQTMEGAQTPMDATAATAQATTPAQKNGERGRAVDAAILQIEKQFGRGAIMRLGDREAQNVPAVSTGSVRAVVALLRRVAELEEAQSRSPAAPTGCNASPKPTDRSPACPNRRSSPYACATCSPTARACSTASGRVAPP